MEKLGLFDSVDDCWLGNDAGPATYEFADLANVARSVATVMLGWDPARIEIRPFAETANTRRDEIETELTAGEALAWLEDNYRCDEGRCDEGPSDRTRSSSGGAADSRSAGAGSIPVASSMSYMPFRRFGREQWYNWTHARKHVPSEIAWARQKSRREVRDMKSCLHTYERRQSRIAEREALLDYR